MGRPTHKVAAPALAAEDGLAGLVPTLLWQPGGVEPWEPTHYEGGQRERIIRRELHQQPTRRSVYNINHRHHLLSAPVYLEREGGKDRERENYF